MSKATMITQALSSRQRLTAIPTVEFSAAERSRVLTHLDEVLSSPAFRNSKRNCSLLKYVIERLLDGQSATLKERTIGVEAFGRPVDYDTAADHSVRSAAGEVRRRLAQYYMDFDSDSGVRIDLPPGSYVPQVRFFDQPTIVEEPLPAAPILAEVIELPRPAAPHAERRIPRYAMVAIAAVVLVAAIVFSPMWRAQTQFEQLWGPILASPNAALVCFGGGQATPAEVPATIGDFERLPARRMNLSDALALVSVTGTLRANAKPFRILNRANAVSFRDLQQGPFILIGAMNNEWTLRLTSGLRFSFQHHASGEGSQIVDRKNPDNNSWNFRYAAPMTESMRDYGLVTRVRDPKTEQVGLIVAGLGAWGTQAASEFVSSAENLQKLAPMAPRNWQEKNLQVVIATDVIRGSSGPPVVLAADFW
ncbi:MAG TPA: hypothetical protein VHW24_12025 [Bryobacteraceae bacterium]|nr:hypothetical protein [Bryobacteraceae bacterium]